MNPSPDKNSLTTQHTPKIEQSYGVNIITISLRDYEKLVKTRWALLQIVKDLRNRSFDPTFKGWDIKKLDKAIAKAEAR